MSEKSPEELGLDLRRQMFGVEGAEGQTETCTDFMRPLQDIVTRICFGEGWQREALDLKTRSLVTLAMLAAMGRTHEIKIHTRGAIANGVTRAELQDLFLHSYLYCGIPLMVDAMKACEEILDELGVE
ncbi:4-carboxymuconolactone decarboxylase [Oceanicola sp. D3]|uniref:carboxymuconolactone decarboxylase family protein n=1 Tax=Oceanicola sp. D3 TaxID=2587163 RepID=UPI001120B388|nr:carboxymuconolactone decarboxylase family protein [Oceanicola sp. D3]QDC10078.1 4-carboxymuconolactone decarboxylase [Oceanicola sp. D3]